MKIEKSMFKSFKGLRKLKKMQKTGSCGGIECKKCPLARHNLNTSIGCVDIIDLDWYAAKDFEEIEKMNKLIEIFTEEKINSILSKIVPNRNLKYNDYVVYDNKTFKIKGVLNKERISLGISNPILLSGYDEHFSPKYKSCIVDKETIEKEYTLWVEPTEIFALNDTVIEKESNTEYKIVAIATPDYPILLNDHIKNFLNINDCKDVYSSIPEAYEEKYNKWVSSNNIKHK